MEAGLGSASGISRSSTQGSPLFSQVLGFFEGGVATDGTHARQQRGVVLSDLPPISQIFHPRELINKYIAEKAPQAAVVMSHDDDWCDILSDVCCPLFECVFISLNSDRATQSPRFRLYQNFCKESVTSMKL
ncbi:hypothetical protein K438DRAFT_245100 [Mycena galopus ATCC 62051]|nr:hypothetical protein K438DRAFT_245100 [Mycena galopus ATCC 62051]